MYLNSMNISKSVTKLFLLLNVYFLWLEMGLGQLLTTISLNRVFFAVVFFFFYVFMLFNMNRMDISIKVNPTNKHLLLVLTLYLITDFFTILYSEVPGFVLNNFTVVVFMFVLFLIMISIFNTERDLRLILITIGLASLSIAAFTLYKFFVVGNASSAALKRITMIRDYNIYSSQIIMGTILLLIQLMSKKINKLFALPLILAICLLSITAVIFTGSRRSLVYLIFACMTILFYYIVIMLKSKNVSTFKKLISIMVILTILVLIVLFTYNSLEWFSNEHGDFVMWRYKTLGSDEAYSDRLERWVLAFREYNKYNFAQLLIGKGAGYDHYLYYKVDYNPKQGMTYPHNMFISDLLNGGIMKISILILLCFLVLVQLFLFRKKKSGIFIGLSVCWMIIFINNLISGDGILYYKPFWIMLALNFITVNCSFNTASKGEVSL